MIAAQLEEDPIRMADTLEYEVRPRIESWGRTMGALSETVAGEGEESLSS